MNEPQPDHILQVGLGFWASKTLLSAVEMELFTELAKHPEDLETLQGRLGLHPRSARDFLDALVALKFLERRNGRTTTRPARISSSTSASHPTSAAFSRWPTIGCIRFGPTSPRRSEPAFRKTKRKTAAPNPFAALYAEPARLKEFLSAMTGVSHGANLAIAHKFPWDKYRTVVDVGTAQGDLITQVALANPAYRGNRF